MKMKSPAPSEPRGVRTATDNAEAFTGGWLEGTIVCVDRSRDLLLLRAQETKRTLAIRWAAETRFAFEGCPASSENLRAGQQARVHCRFANYELEADNISIAPSNGCPDQHVGPVPSPDADSALPALRPGTKSLSLYERRRSYHPDR